MQTLERILIWTMSFIMFATLFAELGLMNAQEFVTVFIISLLLALAIVFLVGRVIVVRNG